MSQHLGKRERKARKRRKRGIMSHQDATGGITLKLGRKKFSEVALFNDNTLRLKKKFTGCVVDAER
jgi:hypothetical protein